MTQPRVSLIIPVFNAGGALPKALGALAQLTPPADEVVLVDNGSTDNSPALLQQFAREAPQRNVRLVHEARRGASVARNAGVRQAAGPIVAFTDADCAPAADWLLHLAEPFRDPAVGGVAGRVVPAEPQGLVELLGALYTLQLPPDPARHRRWTPWTGGFPTANFALRRSLLLNLKGFDEQVGIYGEDYDICARLYAQGAEIAYTPEARVVHHHRTTLTGMLRQAFGFGRSHAYLLNRHGGRGWWLDLAGRSLHLARCPGRLWLDLAAADKKAVAILAAGLVYRPALWLLPVFAAWLAMRARRRAHQARIIVSPSAALGLGALLVLKSAAMTAGRWWGSVKYGTPCF